MREGKNNLLGIGINACMEYSVASLKGFLYADVIEGVSVGIDKEAVEYGGKPPYQKLWNLSRLLELGFSR